MSNLMTKIALLVVLLVPACSAGGGSGTPVPVDPSAVVADFLTDVKAGDLGAMSELWGTKRGPASENMDRDELRKRLTVIVAYLQHDSYEFTRTDALAIAGDEDVRGVSVRLRRAGCEAVVPFTLVPWSGGWLIQNIDLAPIGNPARTCSQPQGG
jgi:hypothetical protein